MTVEEQHIDFKRKLNKVDSQNYRNFRPEEIDLYLNEGQELFVKKRINRNNTYQLGFETTQKRIEDLRDIHIKFEGDTLQPLTASIVNANVYRFNLEDLGLVNGKLKYLYKTRVSFKGTKGECTNVSLDGIAAQTDDLNEILRSEFYNPSFEWRQAPYLFSENFLYVYTDGTFSITELELDYIKRPLKIANPNAIKNNLGAVIGYNYPDGTTAVQTDCELQSMYVTSEIVDESIVLAMMDLGDQRVQLGNTKLNINE
jgi:hypothetical protein